MLGALMRFAPFLLESSLSSVPLLGGVQSIRFTERAIGVTFIANPNAAFELLVHLA